jgi:hypothetical protein
MEPAPETLPEELRAVYGYGQYSARCGPIGHSRQLLQLFQRAFGEFEPREKCWPVEGGFVDPFRPFIEPRPFVSREETLELQDYHLKAVRRLFEAAAILIVVLSQTEACLSSEDGAVYAGSPALANQSQYKFHRSDLAETIEDLKTFQERLSQFNPQPQLIFMVSPEPLGRAPVPIPLFGKAVLRKALNQMKTAPGGVHYFSTYELFHRLPAQPEPSGNYKLEWP